MLYSFYQINEHGAYVFGIASAAAGIKDASGQRTLGFAGRIEL
jgi:hypothetical protein